MMNGIKGYFLILNLIIVFLIPNVILYFLINEDLLVFNTQDIFKDLYTKAGDMYTEGVNRNEPINHNTADVPYITGGKSVVGYLTDALDNDDIAPVFLEEKEVPNNDPQMEETPPGPDDEYDNGGDTDEAIVDPAVKRDTSLAADSPEPEPGAQEQENRRIAYLTFDDGPSPFTTPLILDILKEEDVKATFFVVGNIAERHRDIIIRQYEEGHRVANHTYSHVYSRIYKSPGSFMKEVYKCTLVLQSILGRDYYTRLVRFPGGSFGNSMAPFRQALEEAGLVNVDWNCVNGDAEVKELRSRSELFRRFLDTSVGKDKLVVLMHDTDAKPTTVEVLPDIIKHLKSLGYSFDIIPETGVDY